MRRRDAIWWSLVFAVGTLAYTAAVYPALPETIPVHWGLDGRPDGWWPKLAGVAASPVFQLATMALLWRMPRLAPIARSTTASERASNRLFCVLTAFFGYLQVVTTQAALGPIDVSRWVMGAVFVLFGYIATTFAGLERNQWIGVRTPWSLASDEAWRKTHAFAGRVYLATSVAGFLMVLANSPVWTWLALLFGSTFVVLGVSSRFRD